MKLSPKQAEYLQNSNKLINLKIGAKGSGKTFIDTAFVIPQRIMERKGKKGEMFILGVTKETIERNVLKLMRSHYGELVSPINSRNVCHMFGEDVYCLGAEKVNQITKLQGSTAKYVYGDEVVRWHEEVWITMLATLRTDCSCFDGACNPEQPTHYIKKYIDKPQNQQDLYIQNYVIDDNPFYPKKQLEALKRQYSGTIFYDRYILGLWKRAEGSIYSKFSENHDKYIKQCESMSRGDIYIGVDFGGNKSATTFVATWVAYSYSHIHTLESERHTTNLDPDELNALYVKFITKITNKYKLPKIVYADSAEQVLIRGMRTASQRANINVGIVNSIKNQINERIKLTTSLMGQGRYFVQKECTSLISALDDAVYDNKSLVDLRLDNGTSDIDTLDGSEYSYEWALNALIYKK